MTISSLVFPSFLRTPAYENKKVTFKALKPNEFDTSDSNVFFKGVKDTLDYVLTGLGEKTLDSFNEIKDNAIGIPDGFNLDSSVTLPYPISLSDNQNHNWENTEGLLAQTTRAVMSASGKGISNWSSPADKEKAKNRSKKSKAFASVFKALSFISSTAGSPDKLYGAVANKLGVRKPVIDPGYFQNYNGSAPRSFTMAYTLVPQSQKEAQTIKDIILWFKQYSSPTFVPNTPLMGAPFIFNISFAGNQYISDMFKMDKCVLTGISVDYASDGSFMLYKDGFPKQIGLALNFAEVELKYAQDYAGLVKKKVADKRSKLGSKDGSNKDSKGSPNRDIKKA